MDKFVSRSDKHASS